MGLAWIIRPTGAWHNPALQLAQANQRAKFYGRLYTPPGKSSVTAVPRDTPTFSRGVVAVISP